MTVHAPSELVLAAATGSTGGLGKIGTLAATTGVMYVRADTGDRDIRRALWRCSGSQVHTLTFYRARSRVDSVTLTLSSLADTETFIVNGLTITGEATAGDAAWASRKVYTGGGTDTLDAVQVAALINADYAVATAGTSVAATDKLVITTDEGAHTIVAAAAADYPAGQYALNATAATEMASIVLAINHKQNVKLASCAAGTTITFRVPGTGELTYTAHATVTTAADREFSISGNDSADGDELVSVLNDATYGLGAGYTAVNAAGTVSITRNGAQYPDLYISSSNGTTAACENTAGGVPGVVAAATGATAELSITPTWTKVLTVTEAGDQLTVTDIDVPGVLATSSEAVVTLVPGTPGSAEYASVIYAITGTAAGNVAVANNTLASLIKDNMNAAEADEAADSTTAGTLYLQDNVEGFPHLYLGVANTAGSAGTYIVGATLV